MPTWDAPGAELVFIQFIDDALNNLYYYRWSFCNVPHDTPSCNPSFIIEKHLSHVWTGIDSVCILMHHSTAHTTPILSVTCSTAAHMWRGFTYRPWANGWCQAIETRGEFPQQSCTGGKWRATYHCKIDIRYASCNIFLWKTSSND